MGACEVVVAILYLFFSGCEEREQKICGELNIAIAEKQLLEAQLNDRDSM